MKIYLEMEKDKDGNLSYSQFTQGLMRCSNLVVDNHEAGFDETIVINSINIESLLNELMYDYTIATDTRLYEAFRELDENDDGQIKVEQLKAKIMEMDPYENVDMMLQVIEDFDLNHDGDIDYDEYLKVYACLKDI